VERRKKGLYKKRVGLFIIYVMTSDTDFIIVYEEKVKWKSNKYKIGLLKNYLSYIFKLKKKEYYIVSFRYFIPFSVMRLLFLSEESEQLTIL
jgi:hypothetical protein